MSVLPGLGQKHTGSWYIYGKIIFNIALQMINVNVKHITYARRHLTITLYIMLYTTQYFVMYTSTRVNLWMLSVITKANFAHVLLSIMSLCPYWHYIIQLVRKLFSLMSHSLGLSYGTATEYNILNATTVNDRVYSLITHFIHNWSFRGQVFPPNHWQTKSSTLKINTKPQTLNQTVETNIGLVASHDIWPVNGSGGQYIRPGNGWGGQCNDGIRSYSLIYTVSQKNCTLFVSTQFYVHDALSAFTR